ncbi:MAG: TIGR03960 family B12-binding radical SAM protein [Planctomycetota bacterium]
MDRDAYRQKLETFLPRVAMPGQYIGGEWNSVRKPPEAVRLRVALAFPDAYTVGMSHHGLRILYEILNGIEGVAAERVFAPLPDMEAELRARGLPLATLESMTPLSECDVVGFSLQHELCAVNLLTLLDLGGIPLHAEDRGPSAPLVIAGGPGAFNPEPLARFLDLALLGDGEEALPEMIAHLQSLDRASLDREALLASIAAHCPGWYAPALYVAGEGGRAAPRLQGIPPLVARRVVRDLDRAPHPRAPVVPVVETAHERVTLEIMRGCPNGCRFCQAGMVARPHRERSVETLLGIARDCYAATGYDEIGLLSLSTSDYSRFAELVEGLDQAFAPLGVSLSLPSLRVGTRLSGIPARVSSVRRGSFTIAPEAATERLRAAINKAVSDADLLDGARAAYRAGWRTVKLYFMIGLPTETEEDVRAIPELAMRVARLRGRKGASAVTLSVSNFVPKPGTPFQWAALEDPGRLTEKQAWIAAGLDRKLVSYKAHEVRLSLLEAALARGARPLGAVVEEAWRRGERLSAWSEHGRPELWEAAFAACGIDPRAVACRVIPEDEALPWSHLSCGVSEAFLRGERRRSLDGLRTPPCTEAKENCAGCGVEGCAGGKSPPPEAPSEEAGKAGGAPGEEAGEGP